MEFGNGPKDGVPKLWLPRDQVEQVELHMVIAIGFTLLHFMPILWKNILHLKSRNFLWKVWF